MPCVSCCLIHVDIFAHFDNHLPRSFATIDDVQPVVFTVRIITINSEAIRCIWVEHDNFARLNSHFDCAVFVLPTNRIVSHHVLSRQQKHQGSRHVG